MLLALQFENRMLGTVECDRIRYEMSPRCGGLAEQEPSPPTTTTRAVLCALLAPYIGRALVSAPSGPSAGVSCNHSGSTYH